MNVIIGNNIDEAFVSLSFCNLSNCSGLDMSTYFGDGPYLFSHFSLSSQRSAMRNKFATRVTIQNKLTVRLSKMGINPNKIQKPLRPESCSRLTVALSTRMHDNGNRTYFNTTSPDTPEKYMTISMRLNTIIYAMISHQNSLRRARPLNVNNFSKQVLTAGKNFKVDNFR